MYRVSHGSIELVTSESLGCDETSVCSKELPTISSALNWQTTVPELNGFDREAPMAEQHPLWYSPGHNNICEMLNIFEIVPLTRLSRLHKQFIENEFRSYHLALGPSLFWRSFYSRCRWARAWVARSLPGLKSIFLPNTRGSAPTGFKHGEIIYAILMRPPQDLENLFWCDYDRTERIVPPFHTTLPSLRNLTCCASLECDIVLTAPNLRSASLGWPNSRLPTFRPVQTAIIDRFFFPAEWIGPRGNDLQQYKYHVNTKVGDLTGVVDILSECVVSNGEYTFASPIKRPTSQLLSSALSLPLSSHDWRWMAALPGMSVPSKSARKGIIINEKIDDLNAHFDSLMALWNLFEVRLPDGVKYAMAHTQTWTPIQRFAEGPAHLRETGRLDNSCPHLTLLPLLCVKEEHIENLNNLFTPSLEINLRSYGNPPDLRTPGRRPRELLNWIKKWKEPVRHLIYTEITGEAILPEIEAFVKKNAESIEHIREVRRGGTTPTFDGIVFPKLKTYSTLGRRYTCIYGEDFSPSLTATNSADGIGPSLQALQAATELEHIELPFEAWERIYGDFKKRMDELRTPGEQAVSETDQIIPRFEWPSQTIRVQARTIHTWTPDQYRVIVGMGIQFSVACAAFERISVIFDQYKAVYELCQKYQYKFRILCSAVGAVYYPWDCAIAEMAAGEVTEETWIDLQLAYGVDVEEIRARSQRPLAGTSFGEPTHVATSDGPRATLLGIRGHHVLVERSDFIFDEIRNLTRSKRERLEKWYRQLQASLPPGLLTFSTSPEDLGFVPATSTWLAKLIKERRFTELQRWISLDWVPILDFSKFTHRSCE